MSIIANKHLSNVKGLTSSDISQMKKLGLISIGDCLNYCPFRYDFILSKTRINLQDGHLVTVCGKRVNDVTVKLCKNGKYLMHFRLQLTSRTQTVQVSLFSQFNRRMFLQSHRYYIIYGKYTYKWNNIVIYNLSLLANDTSEVNNMIGVYHSKFKIAQAEIRKVIKHVYNQYSWCINDILPDNIRRKNHFMHRKQSLIEIQKPTNLQKLKLARETEIYTEFYIFLSKLKNIKNHHKSQMGLSFNYSRELLSNFKHLLPYHLTSDQNAAVQEILNDLCNDTQMDRLLQGDVGSGKTVVAMFAILATISSGYQCALMAPTSVLAQQHFETFTRAFSKLGVNVALLTGAASVIDKRNILEELANGSIDLIIGTEALFQNNVNYNALGLIVIDEQHRFGVEQRLHLIQKNKGVNVLSMTATPIPRTLSLMNYGDMYKSILKHGPSGRKHISTKWVHKNNHVEVQKSLLNTLAKHQQAYVIAPLISKSKNKSISNVMDLYKKVKNMLGSQYRVGLLDGKMDAKTMHSIMNKFKNGYYNVLVSTTVIEVGVNIPNATLMVIDDADHFGLAQLHQLRGRVGRSDKQSYCLLVANPSTENGYKRMHIMEHTDNGFVIAQDDLALRDAGNIFGEKQSGLPDFNLANPIKNIDILQKVQNDLDLTKLSKSKGAKIHEKV